jgi:hypothetical protein
MRDSLSNFISSATQSSERSAGSNRRIEFHKRSQLFIRLHNETLSIAMRVNNPDRSPREWRPRNEVGETPKAK